MIASTTNVPQYDNNNDTTKLLKQISRHCTDFQQINHKKWDILLRIEIFY